MRTREKIVTLLLSLTLMAAAVTVLHASEIGNEPSTPSTWTGLWYGGVALFALIIIGMGLKLARDAEIAKLKGRLAEMEAAKAKAESLRDDEVLEKKRLRQAKDSAARELEESSARITALDTLLRENEQLLRSRDWELRTVQSQLAAPGTEAVSDRAPQESMLQKELREKAELLAAKDSTIRELEKSINQTAHAFQVQLGEKDELLQARDREMEVLRAQLADNENGDNPANGELQEELRREKQALQEKDSAIRELQKSLSGKVRALETKLNEKDELLQSRNTELQTLRSEVNTLTDRLAEIGADRTQAESLLQQDLKKHREALQAKDAGINELEKNLAGTIRALESQLRQRDELLQSRNAELETSRVELKALTERLTEIDSAKTRTENLLREELRREKQALQEKDSAIRELEKSLSGKVRALETTLNEKDELLQSRNTEIQAVRSEVNTLTDRLSEIGADRTQAERVLQQELKKKSDLLQSKDAAFRELEENLNKDLHALERQLSEKSGLLEDRDAELETLRSQLAEMTSVTNQAQGLLQEELKKEKQASQLKDAAIKELEKNLSGKMSALETHLTEKDELLQSQNMEIQTLRSEVNTVTGRLADLAAAKNQAETLLQEELKKKTQLLLAKDTGFKELQQNLSTTAHSFEAQLREKDDLLRNRDTELGTLKSQLAEIGSAKEHSENVLLAEVKKQRQALQEKDSAVRELAKRIEVKVRVLETQLGEKEKLLKSRDDELEGLRSRVTTLTETLKEPMAAKERSADDAGNKELEETLRRVDGLETLLSEKEELLKTREKLIERLASELKEKQITLARQEQEVWRAIERRDVWKRRLAKFGITLKD